MRTIIFLSILMMSGSTIIAPSQTIPFTIDGCYVHHHVVPVMEEGKWVDSEVENRLLLKKEGVNKLRFSFMTVSANAHLCTLAGVATRVQDVYEYRSEECPDCVFKIYIKPGMIVLGDLDYHCIHDCFHCCGERGETGAEFLFSEKSSDGKECLDFYEGEVFEER